MANELTLDAIQSLLAGSRARGDYDTVLDEFLNSDAAGIEVDLTGGPLAGKDAKNVVTGFNNARVRMNKDTGQPRHQGGHGVKVIKRTVEEGDQKVDHVFLINTAKLGGEASSPTVAE